MASNCTDIPAAEDTISSYPCLCQDSTICQSQSVSMLVVLETVAITAIIACAFVITKSSYDRFRLRRSRATVVIIGSGPAGVVSAWLVARTGRASRVIVYEERPRAEVLGRTKYLCLNGKSLKFLRSVGLEVADQVEGSWQHQNFTTKTGLFLEHILDGLKSQWEELLDIRFETKFTKDCLRELDAISERIVAIVCDGSNGRSASLLGLSDEFTQHSCRSYGAVASIDHRPQGSALSAAPSASAPADRQPDILPEVRVHHLAIDLNSRGRDPAMAEGGDPFPTSFHLKIFGSSSSSSSSSGDRSMALAVPRCESTVVRTLKTILDQTVMRNIFQECYNKYRSQLEPSLTDSAAVKCLKFSPRLFEIKLLQRLEAAAYIEDADIFVVAEGDAARRVNFCSGMDINLVLSGLMSLGSFVEDSVWVDSEKRIVQTLNTKLRHGQTVGQDFIRHGLKEVMYS